MGTHYKISRHQQGAALLLIIMVMFISISTFIFATANNQAPHLQRQSDVRTQLNLAKEMLLAYAMQYPDISGSGDGPGRLPCPDVDNDTYPDSSCSTTVATFQGRLPQGLDPAGGVTLTFNDEYAGIDQQFWYAVDPNFHWSATAVNSASSVANGFTVDGVGAGEYVAVIIAPGEAVSNQDRVSSPVADSSYLEGGNQDGSSYVSSYMTDPDNFNDQIITISHSELMTLATIRVIQEIKQGLDSYHSTQAYYYAPNAGHNGGGNCSGPWDGPKYQYPRSYTYISGYNWFCTMRDEDYMFLNSAMSGAPSWFVNDGWNAITTYTNSNSYDEATVSFAGCNIIFTFNYDDSAGESIITRSQPEC